MIVPLLLAIQAMSSVTAAEEIVSAWRERDASLATAELTWETVRDSRETEFGFATRPTDQDLWRLRLAEAQWRVDGHRWTVVGRDNRPRPAVADPARARLEFNEILLERRLKGTQTFPQPQRVAAVQRKGLVGDRLVYGELDELLIQGSILALRPLLLVDPSQIVATSRYVECRGRPCHVLEEQISADAMHVFWLDPTFRIVRMINTKSHRPTTQIDILYSEEGGLPTSWSALRIDNEGNVFEFAEAKLTDLRPNPQLDSDVFDVPMQWDNSLGIYNRVRPYLRSTLDSMWLVVVLPGLIGLVCWRRGSRPARTLVVVVLLIGTALVVQQTPIFDPTISEGYHRVMGTWAEAQALRQRSASQAEWDRFAADAQAGLKSLAEEQDACHMRSQQGLWPLLVGRDEAAARAQLDLMGAARHDLPEILAAWPSGNDLRERSLTARLSKVADHISGISPYMVAANAGAAARMPNPLVLISAACGGILLSIWAVLSATRGAGPKMRLPLSSGESYGTAS